LIVDTTANVSAQTADERFERLDRELAEMRTMRAADRAELEALRVERPTTNGDGTRDETPRSLGARIGRVRRQRTGESDGYGGLVSRRRLFGLLGGAAAAGVGEHRASRPVSKSGR
jgi:hypothetical protein